MNKNNLNKDKIDCNGSFTDSLILTANGDIIFIFIIFNNIKNY